MKWGQHESLFSLWTTARDNRAYWLVLAFALIVHILLAGFLPAAEDELYYWSWSKNPSLSYFDHPPMIAWWIFIATRLFGDSLLAVRLPGVFLHLFLFLWMMQASKNRIILYFLLLTPLSIFGAVFMTPDIPLIFFWVLYLIWVIRLEELFSEKERPRLRTWAEGGLILGLGLLSKYTMALAPMVLGIFLVSTRSIKKWGVGFLGHLLLALVLFTPVIWFNIQHHYEPLLFQWNHTRIPVSPNFIFTYLAGQIALLGALPFLLTPWIAINFRELLSGYQTRVLTFFFLIPLVFFLFKSSHSYLEMNWGLVTYLSFWPLASHFYAQSRGPARKLGFIGFAFTVPLLISLVLTIHLFSPIQFIKPHQDRLAKMSAYSSLFKAISANAILPKDIPIYTPTYQWTSYFQFFGFRNTRQLKNVGRASHFTLFPNDPCLNSQIIWFRIKNEPLPQDLSCFSKLRSLIELPLILRENQLAVWELVELSKL
ncbi:hypothetical protein EBR78_06370 [bacterium]|nr:hypothetical protein [bacterium]